MHRGRKRERGADIERAHSRARGYNQMVYYIVYNGIEIESESSCSPLAFLRTYNYISMRWEMENTHFSVYVSFTVCMYTNMMNVCWVLGIESNNRFHHKEWNKLNLRCNLNWTLNIRFLCIEQCTKWIDRSTCIYNTEYNWWACYKHWCHFILNHIWLWIYICFSFILFSVVRSFVCSFGNLLTMLKLMRSLLHDNLPSISIYCHRQ